MNSACTGEASNVCFNGCCSSPFLALTQSFKPYEIEFETATASSSSPNTRFTNHESLPSFQDSFLGFIRAFPGYLQTDKADQIRAQEYRDFEGSHVVYLNHIGHGLFSNSQILLQRNRAETSRSVSCSSPLFDLFSKPQNLSGDLMFGRRESDSVSKIRKRIMGFMNLDESDYSLVFTPDLISAFKLLGESYPFRSNQNLITVYDFENEAVEAMIEISKKRGGKAEAAEFLWPNLEIRSEKLRKKLIRDKKRGKERGLFVFSPQSRVTGARYSYSWMNLARECGWHVLLDACSLGSKEMETLGLSLFKPDFLVRSFFQEFGENPSGFTCLFIKKSSASVLKEQIFQSNPDFLALGKPETDGRIQETAESASGSMHIQEHEENLAPLGSNSVFSSEIVEEEEDRENYTNQEIEFRALDHADSLGLITISRRGRYLTKWLMHALMSLQHPNSEDENGISLVRIYGPKVEFDRGPSVAFNLFDWQGLKIDSFLVQKVAERNRIFLGRGILQNICCTDKKTIVTGEIKDNKGRFFASGLPVITIALGFLTNFEDVYTVWVFFSKFLDADFIEKERWKLKALDQKG